MIICVLHWVFSVKHFGSTPLSKVFVVSVHNQKLLSLTLRVEIRLECTLPAWLRFGFDAVVMQKLGMKWHVFGSI